MKKEFIDKTIELYKNTGWKYIFTKWKFWEEPYTELERLIPKKCKVVDIGCGEGILCNFLAISSNNRQVIGFEIDKKRLAIAQRNISNTEFRHGDATKLNIPPCDVITMFHVMHHLNSYKQQDDVIKKIFKSLDKGGKFLMVEVEIKASLKYWVCWLFDYFFVPWVFEKRFYTPAFFRNSKKWKESLTQSGFSCKIIPAEKNRPFSNVILECTKV